MANSLKDDEVQTTLAELSPSPPDASGNVFTVLAQRASERSAAELWTTAIGGSVNSAFIWWQHPNLHWLGAGFTAAAAYGIWGLADRAIKARLDSVEPSVKVGLLRGLRGLSVPIGILSAVLAMGSFMAAALGGWIH